MPTLPYTSSEFINIINENATLHDEYVNSGNIIQGAATDMQESLAELTAVVDNIMAAPTIIPSVINESGLAPTGTYATAVYYDINYGVKIAYDRLGNVYIIMKGGTTADYENFRFVAGTVPAGVTIETTVPNNSSYVAMMPQKLQVGVIHGITGAVTLTLTMNTAGNATYDYIDVTIDVTESNAE